MNAKGFLLLVITVVVIGGSVGGAFAGGLALGRSQNDDTASESALLQQLPGGFHSPVGFRPVTSKSGYRSVEDSRVASSVALPAVRVLSWKTDPSRERMLRLGSEAATSEDVAGLAAC